MSATIPSTDPFLAMLSPRLFRPFYSPNDMLALGVYGGAFFGPNNAARILPDIDPDLFRNINTSTWKSYTYDNTKNYFQVAGGREDRTYNMTIEQRQIHRFGWFEWYCKFYYGERSIADTGRITQWIKEINRHFYYIKNGVYNGEGNILTDLTFLPERRQKLLELGVDPTKDPYDYGCNYHF